MAWKGVYPKVFGHSNQLSLNKFFDPSTPSMRKGCDGKKKKRIVKIVVLYHCTSKQTVLQQTGTPHRPLMPILISHLSPEEFLLLISDSKITIGFVFLCSCFSWELFFYMWRWKSYVRSNRATAMKSSCWWISSAGIIPVCRSEFVFVWVIEF